MILLLYVLGDGNITQWKNIFLVCTSLSTTRDQGAGDNKVETSQCAYDRIVE